MNCFVGSTVGIVRWSILAADRCLAPNANVSTIAPPFTLQVLMQMFFSSGLPSWEKWKLGRKILRSKWVILRHTK